MSNEEKILQMLGELKAGQDVIVDRLNKVEIDTRHTRILIEQQDYKISLVAEQYTDIAEKLDKANERASQIDDMKDRLRTLETVVMNHTAILKDLRQAQ